MTTPRSERVEGLRDAAFAEMTSQSFADRWGRGVVQRMANSMLPNELRRMMPVLTVTISGSDADLSVVGRMATAVQRATAKMTEGRITRQPVTVATEAVKQRASLRLLPSSSGTLRLELPLHSDRQDATQSSLQGGDARGHAERAVIDLCEYLPSTPSDSDDAMDGIPAADVTVRSAMHDLIWAPIAKRDVTFELVDGHGQAHVGLLVPRQTQTLRKTVYVNHNETVTNEFATGVFDGAQMIRRVFHMEDARLGDRKVGSLKGSIAPEVLDQVRGAEDRYVRVRLEVTRRPRMPSLYNLVEVMQELSP